jgi:hypothetical protein
MKLPTRREHRFEVGLIGVLSFVLIYRSAPYKSNAPGNILPCAAVVKQRTLSFRVWLGRGDGWSGRWKWARITLVQYTHTKIWIDPDVAEVLPTHKSIEFWTAKGKV